MDLWRLLAHANVCVDLAPGAHIARECVEAMRFGTPIIVPDRPGPGAVHARASGGATFRDASELLDAAAALRERGASGRGRRQPLGGTPTRTTATRPRWSGGSVTSRPASPARDPTPALTKMPALKDGSDRE